MHDNAGPPISAELRAVLQTTSEHAGQPIRMRARNALNKQKRNRAAKPKEADCQEREPVHGDIHPFAAGVMQDVCDEPGRERQEDHHNKT